MSQHSAPTAAAQRHHFVDALRGFALLGILVVNIEFIVQPSDIGWAEFTSTTDHIFRWLNLTFAQTKIYPIFATLFGYGLALQLRRNSSSLWTRYRRRMLVLLGLGVLHGALFFPGDILVIYALVGLATFRFRNHSTERLLRIATWVYGLAAVAWLLIGLLDWVGGGSPATADPDVVDALINGSFLDVVIAHFPYWVVTFGILVLVQGPSVVACFLVGIALGRTDVLSNPREHTAFARSVLRWAPLGYAVAGVGAWLVLRDPATETLGFAIGFAAAPLVAASYLAILGLTIGQTATRVGWVLQQSGRMSLTVYLLESVVTATLAYGWGFGLLPDVSPLEGMALAVAIWLGLSVFAVAWMRLFRFGPFEWVLRSLSYGTRQPIRR